MVEQLSPNKSFQREYRPESRMLAAAMAHPTRVEILMSMNAPLRRLSPKLFAAERNIPLGTCSYHFRELAKAGCIRLVQKRSNRGAVEHIYEPLQPALAWTDEWESFPPATKRSVLDSIYRGAIEALGSAIDGGDFEARDESHLSWNTVEVDEQGWADISGVLDRALEKIGRAKRECRSRIARGAESIRISYFLSSFESPPVFDPLAEPGYRKIESSSPVPTKNPRRAKRREIVQIESEQQTMAKVMRHPTRVRILMSMNTPRRRLSATQFAAESGLGVQHLDYHLRELEDSGCIRLVAQRNVRGATENIYEPLKTAIQWTEDWIHLGSAIKRGVLASVTRGAVEAVGSAISSGTFVARSDSHFSWDTIEVDENGWQIIAKILDRALAELIAVDEEVLARLATGAKTISASYFMSSFETPKLVSRLSI